MKNLNLEQVVRKSVLTGLTEFDILKKQMDTNKAYVIAQTKALKTFYDLYEQWIK